MAAQRQQQPYVAWDNTAVEPMVPNEAGLLKEIIQIINKTQEHNFAMHRHAFRGTHVKTQAIVKGTLTVEPDLPPELARGICSAENAKRPHAIAMRFANEPSFLQDDRTPGPRGCSMKVFDKVGDNFLDDVGRKTHTQDFTLNNAPILELRDLHTTVEIFRIREHHFHDPDMIAMKVGQRADADLQMAPQQLPNRHFLSYTMYSQSAYRWGDCIVKYALFPTGEVQQQLEEKKITGASDSEQHSKWLREYFTSNDATYDLRVQVCRDLDKQPVEDASLQWDESVSQFQTVAKVVLPKGQDCWAPERRAFWDEQMRMNVWYGLDEHRPLGSVNRLRKELYKASKDFRTKTNASEIRDVDSVDQIP